MLFVWAVSDQAYDRLGSFLQARGFEAVNLTFPPVELCTDNAAMIAWTGIEMYENGWESSLRCRALRKVSTLSQGILPFHSSVRGFIYIWAKEHRSCSSNVSSDTRCHPSRETLTRKCYSGQLTQMQKMAEF